MGKEGEGDNDNDVWLLMLLLLLLLLFVHVKPRTVNLPELEPSHSLDPGDPDRL